MAEKKKTTVYIPPEIVQVLKELAKQHRRSFNSEVLVALENHIKGARPQPSKE